MKSFIITIDTEGDNLWSWKPGDIIKTNNTKYLQRFQHFCGEFGFKPTWLSNYEMISDPDYVKFIVKCVSDGTAELGMHLHAWNTPPDYKLSIDNNGAPYLIEYPKEIMEQKICTMTELIQKNSGIKPLSHRAGRWATDDRYFELLVKYGYKVDCSITPYINWNNDVGQSKGSKGSDYSTAESDVTEIYPGLIEVPVTIRKTHKLFLAENITLRNIVRNTYRMIKGQELWLRPKIDNCAEMLYLLEQHSYSSGDYIMFMLHSSEMMPGGSPTFSTPERIEKMYSDLRIVFNRARMLGYTGELLSDFVKHRNF